MTLELSRPDGFLGMVDVEKGTVDRRIFSDPEIYQMELQQIFARAWNFMCHDSQIPNPGDFFMTFIGEDRVIVVRDNEGLPRVLVNSCRHRGNAVCRAEEGHATSFMCTYHGWTYDLKGALVGVPGFKEVYHEELDRENWGLIRAAQVGTYKGFVFACMDAEAPPLDEYLGEVGRMCLNQLALRGEMVAVGGVQKYTIPCNWKFAVDNVWDYYHAGITHASATLVGHARQAATLRPGKIATYEHSFVPGEYGHVLSGPANRWSRPELQNSIAMNTNWQERPGVKEELGPVGVKATGHPHIFPNMWLTFPGVGQVSIRLPKGSTTTEIWWFTLVDRNMEKAEQDRAVRHSTSHFGPAGFFEQEDGENWGESTRGAKGVVTRNFALNYAMNVGNAELVADETGPPHYDGKMNEHGQLWHYRAWSEWMAAESWADLKANHSKPTGVV